MKKEKKRQKVEVYDRKTCMGLIPSIMKSVRLTPIDTAAIHIEGRVIVERSTVNSKYGEWKTIQEEWS